MKKNHNPEQMQIKTLLRKGESMNAKKILLSLVLAVAATLMFYSLSAAVPIWEGYDEESMFLTQEGTTSWEDDLEAMEEKEIQKLLNRVRAGDKNVMSYIVYQTYERLHFTVYAISLNYLEKNKKAGEASYVDRFKSKFMDRYKDEDADKFIKRVEKRYAALIGSSYYDILGGKKIYHFFHWWIQQPRS